jgi:hypothetical protein
VAVLILTLNGLDTIIRSLFKVELKLIISQTLKGKKQPDSVLLLYNLTATVHFPTRVLN